MASQTMVLFSNDATETRYTDGSRLQLSPCGASFTLWKPAKHGCHQNQTPGLLRNHRIQQRTRYVVSEHKTRVLQALEFRNQFATCPYLCADIIDPKSLLHIYSGIQDTSWPVSHKDADIKRLPDGTIHITSIDQCVTLKLPSTRQQFSAEFLCKVPRDISQRANRVNGRTNVKLQGDVSVSHNAQARTSASPYNTASIDHNVHLDNEPWESCLGAPPGDKASNSQSNATIYQSHHASVPSDQPCDHSNAYVWVVQHYSVEDCPPCWRHPLQMALRVPVMSPKKSGNSAAQNECSDETKTQESAAELTHTKLPSSLPANCPASHMHSWIDSKVRLDTMGGDTSGLEMEYTTNGGIKVLMVNGVIYRLLHPGGHPSIEIYPGDGSVIKSCHIPEGLASKVYFNHYSSGPNGVEERMYSTSNVPPERPGCLYSLARVVARGSRLLQAAQLHPILSPENPCWKISQQQPSSPIPTQSPAVCLLEKTVLHVGRFSAFSDGYIRIAFEDRTLLDWRCDLSQCIDRYWKMNEEGSEKNCNQTSPIHCDHRRNLSTNVCRLLLPNGQYVMIDAHQPADGYQWYVAMAEEWRTWLNMEPRERSEFYQKQYVNDPQRIVTDELRKIQNFTYLTECVLPQANHPVTMVTEAAPSLKDAHPHLSIKDKREYLDTDDCNSTTRIGNKKSWTDTELSPKMIREALSRTSEAISSIETILDY